MIPKEYYGRLMTASQVPKPYQSQAISMPSMLKKEGSLRCARCHSRIDKTWKLPQGQHYCRSCIVFGRNQEDQNLYYFKKISPESRTAVLNWQGKLTAYQEEVSQALLKASENKEDILVHAVTGAGKTEMIYALLAKVLEQGQRVALVSPRIDVCRELYQRLKRDFTCSIALLHAGSEPYDGSLLLIATTHQLLKFYQAFDLIIVDEVDAFPYVDNPMLYHAVKQAKTKEGQMVYLTATSTRQLERQVEKGDLTKAHLARRFHANPLVLPSFNWQGNLQKALLKNRIPKPLLVQIKKQRQTKYPLLLFFPNIDIGEKVAKILQKHFSTEKVAFVSSKTEERENLVQSFREGQVTILVTTTILERGVTFPCVDVFVCMANHRLYTSSSLIQIGGRVGRAVERPTGQFILFHEGINQAMRNCRKEIREMNQKGGFNGVSHL